MDVNSVDVMDVIHLICPFYPNNIERLLITTLTITTLIITTLIITTLTLTIIMVKITLIAIRITITCQCNKEYINVKCLIIHTVAIVDLDPVPNLTTVVVIITTILITIKEEEENVNVPITIIQMTPPVEKVMMKSLLISIAKISISIIINLVSGIYLFSYSI
jgi:hypothetical protein